MAKKIFLNATWQFVTWCRLHARAVQEAGGSLLASAVRVGPQGGELSGLLGDGEELNRPRKDQKLESEN